MVIELFKIFLEIFRLHASFASFQKQEDDRATVEQARANHQ
jgi:hypothetical protein